MKISVAAICFLFAVSCFAKNRSFDCQVTKLQNAAVQGLEDLNLDQNSTVSLVHGAKESSFQIGDLVIDNHDMTGPALVIKSSMESASVVQYVIYIDGSLEYEMNVNVYNLKTELFWWGLGEKMKLASLSCLTNN